MKYRFLPAVGLSLALAACAGEPGSSADPADGLSDEVDEARFDGIGPASFGMSEEEVREAWPGELNGGPGAEGSSCYHLNPVGQPGLAYFALMFEDGGFVRYSVANENLSAPGGGRVGMDGAGIEQRYGAAIERGPHKYVEGGEYLRIADPAGGEGVLIFETNADGIVTEWRAGVPPPVDYVEGCG